MVIYQQDGRESERQVEKMDTSTIDVRDMDSLRAENERLESMMPSVGIKQIKSEDNPHVAASQVYGQVEEAEIEKFFREHPPTSDDAHRRDIKVAELRRIIPLLIIKQFNIRKDPTQKKVKGMWNEKPKNWPTDLPYCDPNNQLKGEKEKGKPSQKILLRMFGFLSKLYLESRGMTYPEQEVIESPITHNLTASGSPVAIDSRPYIKMENRDAGMLVLGTGPSIPITVTASTANSMSPMPSHHLQSSAMVTSVMSQPVTTVSNTGTVASEQPKLQALLQSSTGTSVKPRNKAPTVNELLHQNSTTPQTLQQTIIIKPPPQIVHHVNQQGTIVDQASFVNSHQAMQAVRALQDGQNYLIQSFPMLTQSPISVTSPASRVDPYPHGTEMTPQPPQQHAPSRGPGIAPNRTDAAPAHAFTEPVVSQTNSPPMDIDPLSVLSATAAEKQPLPVPNSDRSSPTRPPPSHLHVIQPASGQHEIMETTRPAEVPENTPVQVEEEDWDPFADLKQQCSKKLKYLGQKKYLDETNTARLNIIKDLIDKMYMVREHDPEFFLNTAHEFVSTLDIIKATRRVPETHMIKWREFEVSSASKEKILCMARKAYPKAINCLLAKTQQPGAWYKAMSAPHIKTPRVANEEEVVTTENNNNSTVNLADLGITPVTPVTLGTMQQLQMKGELNLRIIHDNEQTKEANPEVEAIKKDLKSLDEQLSSPRPSIDGTNAPQEPQTPGSTTSEQHLEDIQQVLIMDSLKEAFNMEQKQNSYCPPKTPDDRDATKISSKLYVSVEEPEETRPLMNYRNPTEIVSPYEQSDQMSPTGNDFTVHRDQGQPVEPHWTQLNVQPPGSGGYEAPQENSIAAELLEQIRVQGISEKHMPAQTTQTSLTSFGGDKIRNMASAYINLLANVKGTNHADNCINGQFYCGSGQGEPAYNGGYDNRGMIPTVVDEVQDVFEKSDMLGPPPAKKAAKRRCSGQTVN